MIQQAEALDDDHLKEKEALITRSNEILKDRDEMLEVETKKAAKEKADKEKEKAGKAAEKAEMKAKAGAAAEAKTKKAAKEKAARQSRSGRDLQHDGVVQDQVGSQRHQHYAERVQRV